MIIDVFSQPYSFFVLLYGGLAAGLVYECLRPLRLLKKPLLGFFADLVFLLFLFFSLYGSLLIGAYGIPRYYTYLTFGLGMLLCRWGFRPIFTEITQKLRKKQFRREKESAILNP